MTLLTLLISRLYYTRKKCDDLMHALPYRLQHRLMSDILTLIIPLQVQQYPMAPERQSLDADVNPLTNASILLSVMKILIVPCRCHLDTQAHSLEVSHKPVRADYIRVPRITATIPVTSITTLPMSKNLQVLQRAFLGDVVGKEGVRALLLDQLSEARE